ncbi:MAG: hypothetical protein KDD73_15830 [Anaerolineales bacterium]|nr:hypothetical protein [Anaerolineales bacterium]MCB9127739.1 hypothetical protein [Ardenticatenales bacterium]
MEEWNEQFSDESEGTLTVEMIQSLLADRHRSEREKLQALSILTNMASDESIRVLRWYSTHADPGMEVASNLALIEADRLNHTPQFDDQIETLLELIYDGCEIVRASGTLNRASLQRALVTLVEAEGWIAEQHGRALIKQHGFLAAMVPIELVINGQILISFWDDVDQEVAWLALDREQGEELDPFTHFYTLLRASNLPWGIQIDISGEGGILTDVIQNLERDERQREIEYILAMPSTN